MRDCASKSSLSISIVLAVFLVSGLPQSATAQDRVWRTANTNGNVALLYGVPGAVESNSFSLFCDNATKESGLEIYAAMGGAEEGRALTMEISTGSAKVTIPGEAGAAEAGGDIVAKAKGFAVKPLLAVLGAEGVATVTVSGVNTLFADSGRAEAVAEFAKSCKLD
jgi:hypothetical protein